MAARLALTALLALSACSSMSPRDDSAAATSPDASAGRNASDLPDSPPMREPHTTYLEVKNGDTTVGYMVRYDAVPEGSEARRRYREGTVFVEDAEFKRIGFITRLGRGYRFRSKNLDAEELGQGNLEQLAALFFGSPELTVTPLR